MKILAIDTSAKAASAALLEDEKLLGEFYTHSRPDPFPNPDAHGGTAAELLPGQPCRH